MWQNAECRPGPAELTIGELSELTAVSTRSLRYYEEQGLLASERTTAGHRRFSRDAAQCVRFIQDMFDAGLSSSLVRTLARERRKQDYPLHVRKILLSRRAEIEKQLARDAKTLQNLEDALVAFEREASLPDDPDLPR